MKKFFVLVALMASLSMADLSNNPAWQINACQAETQQRNDGTYSPTSQSVTIYTESGHHKGSYTVYLHQGRRYIRFQGAWICIQGKSRFAHNGNWYVIK